MNREQMEEIADSAEIPFDFLQELVENPNEKKMHGDNKFVWHGELEVLIKFDGEKKFRIRNTDFDTLEEVLSIKKNDVEYTLDDAIREYHDSFYNEKNKDMYNPFALDKDHIEEVWNSVEPMTAKEAIRNYPNMEHRMIALRWIGAEGLIEDLDAEILDTQTVHKEQEETVFLGDGDPSPENAKDPSLWEKRMKEYDDTYTLYRIDSDEIVGDAEDNSRRRIELDWVYVCGMKDASTDREYYIFIDPEVVQENEDAIEAIASTLRVVDGEGQLSDPLTKDDYFKLQSET